MISPTSAQTAVAGQIAAAVDSLGVTDPTAKLACICCALVESSLAVIDYGDISSRTGDPSTSIGPYQQTEHWGTRAQRLDVLESTRLFLVTGTPGDIPYLRTDPALSVPYRIQITQGSQYDGVTDWRKYGRPYGVLPRAQNYIDALPLAQLIVKRLPAETPVPVPDVDPLFLELFGG